VRKSAIILLVLCLCLSGSQVFAIDPGVYNFGGTISVEAFFGTGGTGQHAADTKGYFCIQGLEVSEPDGNGVQTITGSDSAINDYGFYMTGLRFPVIECLTLDPTGQITGFIDNNGNHVPATVKTVGTNCEFLNIIQFPCDWDTWEEAPPGPAGTVVMNIPLDSTIFQDPPHWVTYGDPSATSHTATANVHSCYCDGCEDSYTQDSRYGVPLVGSSGVYNLEIVSPDVHFKEDDGLLIMDVISFTRFKGTLTQGPCPAEKPSWTACSTIGPESEVSHVLNYLLMVLLPVLFISIGVLGRRR